MLVAQTEIALTPPQVLQTLSDIDRARLICGFPQITRCCGAARCLEPETLKYFQSRMSNEEFLQQRKVAWVFSPVQLEGFEEICPGLFYIKNEETWNPPGGRSKWGTYPTKFDVYQYGKLPYLAFDNAIFNDINLIANFPEGDYTYDIKSNFEDNVKRNRNTHSIAVLNKDQGKVYEKLVLNAGFTVVNRSRNLQYPTGHWMTLYYRPPGEAAFDT